jgi:disulfide bond formation protein DsbB
MTNELITKPVACSKKSAPEPKLLTMSMAFFAFFALLCGLIALAAYNLAHTPELWNVITGPTS